MQNRLQEITVLPSHHKLVKWEGEGKSEEGNGDLTHFDG